MRPQPLIAVTDVEASSRWYQRLLGCQSAHGGAEYERLVSNGALILQLHRFEVEHAQVGTRARRQGSAALRRAPPRATGAPAQATAAKLGLLVAPDVA